MRSSGGVEFLHYVAGRIAVTEEVLALAAPAKPTEVFRFAAPCAESACTHFDGANCRLASKIVAGVDDVVNAMPPCRIRPTCRWYQQEGRMACLRCPLIFSETANPSPELRYAADPSTLNFRRTITPEA
jgi:hypothetical protein